MKCALCGNQVEENTGFCGNCGAPLEQQAVESTDEASVQEPVVSAEEIPVQDTPAAPPPPDDASFQQEAAAPEAGYDQQYAPPQEPAAPEAGYGQQYAPPQEPAAPGAGYGQQYAPPQEPAAPGAGYGQQYAPPQEPAPGAGYDPNQQQYAPPPPPNTRPCPYCGAPNDFSNTQCGNCGNLLQPNMAPGYEQKSKMAAGLLGIFLGSLGVHNFYLGYTGKAVAQLLISVLSLGFLAFASAIWGLIEGILILTGSNGFTTDAKGIPLKD